MANLSKINCSVLIILALASVAWGQHRTEANWETNNTFTGNNTHSGTETFTNAVTVTNAGIWSNSQMNLYVQSLLNGCSPATEIQGNVNATLAITGCNLTPASTTALNSFAVAGFGASLCNSNSATRCNTGGGMFYGVARANGAAVWGVNPNSGDVVGVTGALITGVEVDIGIQGTPAQFRGISMYGVGGGTPPGYPDSYWIGFNALTTSGTPEIGLQSNRGAVSVTGILLDGLVKTNPSYSQRIAFNSYDSGGTIHQSYIQSDSAGNVVITPASGAAVLGLIPTASTGHALCETTAHTVGHCTSVVAADGTCTCS